MLEKKVTREKRRARHERLEGERQSIYLTVATVASLGTGIVVFALAQYLDTLFGPHPAILTVLAVIGYPAAEGLTFWLLLAPRFGVLGTRIQLASADLIKEDPRRRVPLLWIAFFYALGGAVAWVVSENWAGLAMLSSILVAVVLLKLALWGALQIEGRRQSFFRSASPSEAQSDDVVEQASVDDLRGMISEEGSEVVSTLRVGWELDWDGGGELTVSRGDTTPEKAVVLVFDSWDELPPELTELMREGEDRGEVVLG